MTGTANLTGMTASSSRRKTQPGPDLGLAPGEPGFAEWLQRSVAEAEDEAKRKGTLSAKQWFAHTDALLAAPVKVKPRKAG